MAYGMGLTAEKVAHAVEGLARGAGRSSRWQSHQKAHRGAAGGRVRRRDDAGRDRRALARTSPPARSTSRRAASVATKARAPTPLWRRWPSCKPVFAAKGSVTAGNSSQTSRRRRRADPGQREDPQAVQPDAAGALRLLRGARRAAGNHGHRPERSDSRGLQGAPASPRTRSTGSN